MLEIKKGDVVLKDLKGKRFGRLTVIKRTDKRYNDSVVWECLCDCGNTCEVSAKRLSVGNVKSCGCFKQDNLERIHKEIFVENTSLNSLVQKKRTNNKSGVKGVCWDKQNEKWCAYIGLKGRSKRIGRFHKFEDAVKARKRAEEELYEPILNRYGKELKGDD